MNKELDLTIEDFSTIAEYMRGDDPDKPVVVDMRYLKSAFMTSSRLISFAGDHVCAGAVEKQ